MLSSACVRQTTHADVVVCVHVDASAGSHRQPHSAHPHAGHSSRPRSEHQRLQAQHGDPPCAGACNQHKGKSTAIPPRLSELEGFVVKMPYARFLESTRDVCDVQELDLARNIF